MKKSGELETMKAAKYAKRGDPKEYKGDVSQLKTCEHGEHINMDDLCNRGYFTDFDTFIVLINYLYWLNEHSINPKAFTNSNLWKLIKDGL